MLFNQSILSPLLIHACIGCEGAPAWCGCVGRVGGHRAALSRLVSHTKISGGLAASKQQASRGPNWGPDFSISSAAVRTAPELGVWVPPCKTINQGPELAAGTRRWLLCCSKWPQWPWKLRMGQNRPKTTQNSIKAPAPQTHVYPESLRKGLCRHVWVRWVGAGAAQKKLFMGERVFSWF